MAESERSAASGMSRDENSNTVSQNISHISATNSSLFVGINNQKSGKQDLLIWIYCRLYLARKLTKQVKSQKSTSSRHQTTRPSRKSTQSVSQRPVRGSWIIQLISDGETAIRMAFFGSQLIQAAENPSYQER